ncbi:MAG: hypothetical protein WA269_08895 [Candidatus Udaeobacter sp.]
MRPTASVLPQTFRRVAGKKLLEFLRKSHGKMMQESALYTRNGGFQAAEGYDGWEAVTP